MTTQSGHPADANLPHGQDSRETELIECVKAFGANLLRDIDERKLELSNLLDRLDTLNGPGNRTTRGAPPIPAVGGASSGEHVEFPWQGIARPSLLRATSTFRSSYQTKYRHPATYHSRPQLHPHIAISTTNISCRTGLGPTTPKSRVIVHHHPPSPTDTIILTNPFTGQHWPLTPPPEQPHESDQQQNHVEEEKCSEENQDVTPHKSGELSSKIPFRMSMDTVVNAAQEVIKGAYLLALLRLPPMYFVRVGRVIHDAELSQEDVDEILLLSDDAWENMTVWADSRRTKLATFKSSWESFASSLIKEWKTFNVVSVLLLSSVVAILQLQTDPSSACQISALLSLLFGLMSLLYGCLYIIRFGTMKKMYSAARYVENAKKTDKSAFWNAWVLIAMPAVWLSWSIICFFVCILSYVWQGQGGNTNSGTTTSTPPLPFQIAISVIFSIGIIYFAMVVRVFNHYAREDLEISRHPTLTNPLSPAHGPPTGPPNLQAPKPFSTFKLLQNMDDIDQHMEVPVPLRDRDTAPNHWRSYIVSLAHIWRDRPPANTAEIVDVWNDEFFIPRGVQIIFCMEGLGSDPGMDTNPTTPISPTFARDRAYRLGRYVLYVTHLPDGKPWANLTLTLRTQTPDWLGGYHLEEEIKYIKPLGGAATDAHTRRWVSQQ
ncbi:hypothetical protein BD779DRAFT_1679471 [Infundibulicybe gibba]|nr:hypothetical protein BD779DRAFT_1679471 [Infundibulicybe gibba]